MKRLTIGILGGTGFVGHHLVNELARAGHRVRLIARRRERHRELLVYPGLSIVQGSVMDEALLREQLHGCNAVINLVAILNEDRRARFDALHVDLPRRVARLCVELGVPRLLHMSALNADAQQGPSRYLRSKGAGEDAVHATEGLQVTSFRPSVIFGPGDHFFNRFATLLRLFPALPLACADARFAPVFVGDVVEAMVFSLDAKATYGQRYELCGPNSYSLQQLVEYAGQVIGKSRAIIPLGDTLSGIQARVLARLPGKLLTPDNIASMQKDAVCRGERPKDLPQGRTSIEAVVPYYLNARDQRARYYDFRREAGRQT